MKMKYFIKKNLKYLIVIGIGGILVFGGLFIYLSYSVISHVANLGKDFDISAVAKNIPVVSNVACMDKAKSLMNVTAWIGTSPMDNLIKLKQVCLEETTVICNSPECDSPREIKIIKQGEQV